jgi:hypothetical protein
METYNVDTVEAPVLTPAHLAALLEDIPRAQPGISSTLRSAFVNVVAQVGLLLSVAQLVRHEALLLPLVVLIDSHCDLDTLLHSRSLLLYAPLKLQRARANTRVCTTSNHRRASAIHN